MRGQRLLDGEVKIPGFRKGGSLRVRYVTLSIAIEGKFWAPLTGREPRAIGRSLASGSKDSEKLDPQSTKDSRISSKST